MCGICGVAYNDPARAVDPELLRRMTDRLTHRGPDDDGYLVTGSVGLGMRRLSIIDVAGGRQPIGNEDASVQAVLNGEIYNYRELRDDLARRGHRFATGTDTESIVHAYEEHGEDALTKLRGMFAIALWDARAETLLLAIDRFGIKPLYVASSAEGLAFGSELSALPPSELVDDEIDHDALAEYFTLGYIPAPRTIFRGVRKLLPGQLVRWKPGTDPVIRSYVERRLPRPLEGRSAEALREGVLHHLRDSVRAHMVSDVPVGAFLSGGIDSGAIVALMSQESTEPVKTFSIGFADPRHNELPLAKLVADRYRTEHRELIIEPEAIDVLPRIVRHFGEPFADASALPTYYVSKMASDFVKVALSGDGGDEMFVGYTSFQGLELARLAQSTPRPVKKAVTAVSGSMASRGPDAWRERLLTFDKRVKDTFQPPEMAYRNKLLMPGLGRVRPFLSAELGERLTDRAAWGTIDSQLTAMGDNHADHPLRRFIEIGFRVSLPNDMLVKVDRMSMANSLEVRVPMLDHVLRDFVDTIPVKQLFPRWRLKGLLRDSIAPLLPEQTLKQRKHGFTVPITSWFKGNLASFAKDVLLSDGARARGFIDPAAVERSLQSTVEGGGLAGGSAIWNLLMFEIWCDQVLEAA